MGGAPSARPGCAGSETGRRVAVDSGGARRLVPGSGSAGPMATARLSPARAGAASPDSGRSAAPSPDRSRVTRPRRGCTRLPRDACAHDNRRRLTTDKPPAWHRRRGDDRPRRRGRFGGREPALGPRCRLRARRAGLAIRPSLASRPRATSYSFARLASVPPAGLFGSAFFTYLSNQRSSSNASCSFDSIAEYQWGSCGSITRRAMPPLPRMAS